MLALSLKIHYVLTMSKVVRGKDHELTYLFCGKFKFPATVGFTAEVVNWG